MDKRFKCKKTNGSFVIIKAKTMVEAMDKYIKIYADLSSLDLIEEL